MVSPRRWSLSLATAAVAAAGLGAALLPSYGHDDTHSENEAPTTDVYVDRIDDRGEVVPEDDHPIGHHGRIQSLEDLQALESEVDPDGSPFTYVCANPGDVDVKMVYEFPSTPEDDANRKSADEIGRVIPGADPCEGRSLVAGR